MEITNNKRPIKKYRIVVTNPTVFNNRKMAEYRHIVDLLEKSFDFSGTLVVDKLGFRIEPDLTTPIGGRG